MSDLPEDFVVFGAPIIDDDDIRAVVRTLRSGWLGPGPQVQAFEEEFAAFVGARGGVGVSSCTAALHLALLTLDLEAGDEVITSPITFPATANAIVHAGGVPVFADVRDDGNIDPQAVSAVLGPQTRAILPVHYAGLPCDMDALAEIAQRAGLTLLQDAAHAVETRWRGRRLGSFGPAAYSFYATKNLATGEGGMLTSTDVGHLARVRLLSQHGVSRNAWSRYRTGNLGGYEVVEPGFNYALTDIQASLGRSQLSRLEGWHRRRAEIVEMYDVFLAEGPVRLPPWAPEHAEHAHHLYPVLAPSRAARDALRQRLFDAGIGTGIHFEAVHLNAWYRGRFGYQPGSLPVAEGFGARTLSLPLSPALSDATVERVAKEILAW